MIYTHNYMKALHMQMKDAFCGGMVPFLNSYDASVWFPVLVKKICQQ